jgi:hypothetical protein
MLDGMSRLVRGDAERGHARVVVHIGGEAEALFDRIVMVA